VPQDFQFDLTALGNPMEVAATIDSFPDPPAVAPRWWSESSLFAAWSPDSEVGVWAHVGRSQADLGLWWAHVAAYLPGGILAVDTSWGRASNLCSTSTGNFTIKIDDPHRRWAVSFDGASELVSTAEALTRPVGAGLQVPMRWEIQAVAASPPWTPYPAGTRHRQEWAGDSHKQQTFHASGSISVAGDTYELDGPGYGDHSRGIRDLAGFGGDQWFIGLLPDYAFHLVDIYGVDGETHMHHGGIFGRDGYQIATARKLDGVDVAGAPTRFDLVIDREGCDQPLIFAAEVLHTLPITVTEDNDNLNGAGWNLPDDPLLLCESVVKLTGTDGKVGFASRETGMRRSEAIRRRTQTID
jgi:hypothetical protein